MPASPTNIETSAAIETGFDELAELRITAMRESLERVGRGLASHVGALKDSASNRFYQRHGFALTGESEWDNHHTRPAAENTSASGSTSE